jgi:hypothetical protein
MWAFVEGIKAAPRRHRLSSAFQRLSLKRGKEVNEIDLTANRK